MKSPVLWIVIPVVCYLLWLFIKLWKLSRRQSALRRKLFVRGAGEPLMRGQRRRRDHKE